MVVCVAKKTRLCCLCSFIPNKNSITPLQCVLSHGMPASQYQRDDAPVLCETGLGAWQPSWNASGFLKLNDKSVCVCVRLGVLINTLLIISANYFPLKFFTFTAIFLLQDVSTDLNATPLIIFHMSATRKSLSGKASDSSPLIKSPIKYSYHWK